MFSIRLALTILTSISLYGCATSFWDKNHYPHLEVIELEETANSWAQSLMRMQNYAKSTSGSELIAQKKYEVALNWPEEEIISRGEAIAVRKLRHSYMENGEFVHVSWNGPDIENIFDKKPDLKNYIKYAEFAVLGRARARKDNPMLFDIEVEHNLAGIPFIDNFSVTNAAQGHIGLVRDDMSHQLRDGQFCVFFPSETYTKYRKAFPLTEFEVQDEKLLYEVFPRMCGQENGSFTFTSTAEGEALLFKEDILQLAPPIVRDNNRPVGLQLTNSVAAINSWDILTVNGYRFPRPIASLSISRGTHHRDLKMICGPNLYGGQILDGKYKGGWAYSEDDIKHCKDRQNAAFGYAFSKNFQIGTFYGDRQTLYFDSPDLYFIAKRANRGLKTGAWSDQYNMHDVERCAVDHPKIGVERYGGYKFQHNYPVRGTLYLTEEGSKYWEDCKGFVPIDLEIVNYNLALLIEKTDEINWQLKELDAKSGNQAYLDENKNSIELQVEPKWADSNREAFERLKEQHPYLAVKEEVFGVVVLTGQ
ncbi:MAG: hypothetical protein ABJG88_13320 [Litorimonas sp.]